MKQLFIIPAIIAAFMCRASAQNIVSAKDAVKHIKHEVTICDKVVGSNHTSGETLLYLGEEYPNQPLTIVIQTANLSKFKGHPDIDLKGKEICVKGIVTVNKGKPEIVVTDPRQIRPYLSDNIVMPSSKTGF